MKGGKKRKTRVGIIGCGAIFPRHLEAIDENKDSFELVGICDIDEEKLDAIQTNNDISAFTEHKKMLKALDGSLDMVTIATPNSLHYPMAMDALNSGYSVLVEKPVDFQVKRIHQIGIRADEQNLDAFAVLQVRYNPTVSLLQKVLKDELLGTIRIVDFVQKWQRPFSYFDGWRGQNGTGGGTLYEVAIHYLDIVQLLFGIPRIHSSATYSQKHKHVDLEDTIFAIAEYPNGPTGSIEVTIASEPINIECAISIQGSEGYLKIGGKALESVETALFETEKQEKRWRELSSSIDSSISPNSYGTHAGSCPNHPTLYKKIAEGRGIRILETTNSIDFIERIYKADNIEYLSDQL